MVVVATTPLLLQEEPEVLVAVALEQQAAHQVPHLREQEVHKPLVEQAVMAQLMMAQTVV